MDISEILFATKLAGGGSGVTVESLSVTSNGTYSAPSGKAYDPVEVDVPNTYSSADEGKVVSSGVLVPQTSSAVSANGLVDTTLINSLDVNVSGGGGDEDAEDNIIMRTISGVYSNSRVTEIGSYAFFSCKSLTSVSFPAVESIKTSAFYNCSSLANITFPLTAYIGSYAFYSCPLISVDFPSAIFVSESAFANCKKIKTVYFPLVKTINPYAFQNCYSLTTASFPEATTIGTFAFAKAFNLISFYLMGSVFASLGNSAGFSSTPIGGYTTSTGGVYGSIYVPSSLYETYISATNWAYFSERFVSV